MKGKEFSELLNDFARVLHSADANHAADALHTVACIFSSAPDRKVRDVCGVLRGLKPLDEDGNAPRLHEMLRLFPALRRLLQSAKASKATVDRLDELAAVLEAHSRSSAGEVRDAAIKRLRDQTSEGAPQPPSGNDLVETYAERLDKALGDEKRFPEVFHEAKADSALRPADARKLAKQFAKETAKSREQAFKLIWGRHAALIGARARQKANKGRTAA